MQERENGSTGNRIYEFIRPYLKEQLITLLCIIAGSVLSLQYPLIIKILVDDVIINKNSKMLALMVVVYTGVILLGNFFGLLTQFMSTMTSQLFTFDLKKRIFVHFHNLPMKFFNKTGMGEIISNFSKDIETISRLLSSNLLNILNNIFSIAIIVVILLFLNWKLALLLYLVLPFYYFSFIFTKELIKKNSNKNRNLVSEENKLLQNAFTNIKLTKIFGAHRLILKRFLKIQNDTINSQLRTMVANSLLWQIVGVISLVGNVVIIWFGTRLVYNSELTIGGLMAFYTFVPYLFNPIRNLTDINSQVREFEVSFKRVIKYFDIPTENCRPSKKRITKGSIEFRDVVFGYEEKQVLKGISFHIEPQEKVALMGRNGSGKSTLVNILLALYSLDSGNILIDGVDISEMSSNYLRKNIGIVSQEMSFYNLSIEDNLMISNPYCTKEGMIKACELAGAHEFISQLPEGYATVIGEGGHNFSGGQLQKLAIARLILKDSRIIIFDEATSALDHESSHAFYSLFDTIFKDKTILFIIHDIRNVIYADRVIYLNDGLVEKEYSDDELQNNNELLMLLSRNIKE